MASTRYKTTISLTLKEEKRHITLTYVYDGITPALIKAEDISKKGKERLRINLWAILSPESMQVLLESCLEDEMNYSREEKVFDEVDQVSLKDLREALEIP